MIVKFEMNLPEDNSDFEIVKNANKFYLALHDISSYLREVRKGWKNPTVDEIEEFISSIIADSGIWDIE